jgi:hypothetical protein
VVSASDIEKSLKEQLKLTSLVCSRLKSKFDSYASFHVSVSEDDFPLTNNSGIWPSGCLIALFYGYLSADQIDSVRSYISPGPLHLMQAVMLLATLLLLAQVVL